MTRATSNAGRRLARVAPVMLVGVLPAVLIALGSARFILNHFFAQAPYLLDSGLLSGITYRSGPMLTPPAIACDYATSFYQVYFSPIIGAFSALSYLLPVERIEWFAFVMAIVYLPIGWVGYALASRLEPGGLMRRLPITMLAALGFAFSGVVIWMVSFPHYEAATPGLVCLTLVAVATGRTRATWVFLGLAALVRQDGGGHVAIALLPLIYLRWRGTAMAPSLRRLVATFAIAIGASAAAFVAQKLLVVPVDRLTPVYFGAPPYAHLTGSLLVDRIRGFLSYDQVIYYPFLATLTIAALTRDARYLLGWLACVPWFAFNFTAHDDAKSAFAAYTAGPFLVAMFWVYLYGGLFAPPHRRLRAAAIEALFVVVCASSTLGMDRGARPLLRTTARRMAFTQPWPRAAVHGFVDALHRHKPELGRLYVDDAVAALAQEWLGLGDVWQPGQQAPPDALAFHERGDPVSQRDLIANQLDVCSHVLDTGVHICTRDPRGAGALGVPVETLPAVFLHAPIHRPGVVLRDGGIELSAGAAIEGHFDGLAPGTYEWRMTLAGELPVDLTGAMALAIGPVHRETAQRLAPGDAHEVVVRFETGDETRVSYELTSRVALRITAARLRAVPGPAAR